MSRFYEAVIVLVILALLVLGIVWVADSLTLHAHTMSFYLMVIVYILVFILTFLFSSSFPHSPILL